MTVRCMNNKGFSLLELLIGLAIFSILLVLSYPMTGSWRQSAQNKAVARDILSNLRRARSAAVHDNQNKTFSIDLDSRQYSLDGDVASWSGNIDVECKDLATDAWSKTGTFSIVFHPQGSADKTIFIRVNQESNLQVVVDASATGLAHM